METKFTPVQYAKFWLECYDRMTDHFSRPLDSYTDQELRDQWPVTDWFLKVAPFLMEKVLHPKHKPELRLAIAYLTSLKEIQIQQWVNQTT